LATIFLVQDLFETFALLCSDFARDMRIRTLVFALLGTIGAVPLLGAQYIRIGVGDAIPNDAIKPPTILKSTPALYTDEARTHGIEGTVTIVAEVGSDGEIKYTRVLKGLGFGLDEAATASVREWALSPATRNGTPVEVVAQIDVEFNLRSANAFRIGAGMIAPTVQRRVEPQYTDEARLAGYNGTVVLQAVIKKDGTVDIIRVVRGLPLGLTDNAIQALKQWQFKPGTKDGQEVDIAVNVEINFNLQRKK
jgi:TonB family protein